MADLKLSEELESILDPYRAEHREIVKEWIESGTFRTTYPAYLVEVFHESTQVCSLMDDARARLDPSQGELRAYFARHVDEERGHDEWVLDDLEPRGNLRPQVRSSPRL